MISLALIVIYFISFSNAIFYDCSDNTITISLNTPTFFTTTDFPLYMNVNDYQNCSLKFVLNATEYNNDVKLIVSFRISVNSSSFMDLITRDGFTFNMKDFFDLYPMSIDETAEYIAQQGFVVFENTKNSCPLESFTRAKPFKFSNVNEMIYINADYDEKSKKGDMKCIWRFTAPFGYGFKIVILSPAYPGLLIENTTDIILNYRSSMINRPIYNSDTYVKISLEKDEFWLKNETRFMAYVSIVQQKKNKTIGSCYANDDPFGVEWTNMYTPYQTYEDNTICKYTIEISPYQIVEVKVNVMDLETGVDFLSYYFGDDENNAVFLYPLDPLYTELLNNGLSENLTFTFKSDGSIQYSGFSIIIIGKCDMPRTMLKFNIDKEQTIDDTIRVFSNNITVFEGSDFEYEHVYIYLNSSDDNIIEIKGNFFWVYVAVYGLKEPIEIVRIFIKDLHENIILDSYTFELAEISLDKNLKSKNITFEIISATYPLLTYIYTNEALNESVVCFSKLNRCNIKSENLIFYLNYEVAISKYFYIRLRERPHTCLYDNNVYTVKEDTSIVTAISSKNYECEVILFIDEEADYMITHLWTTASEKPVRVFIGTDRKTLFLEFNSTSANLWKEIGLYSKIYAIRIPKNKSIFMIITSIDSYSQSLNPYERHIYSVPYQSVVSTPYYGVSKYADYFEDGTFMIFDIGTNFTLKVTATAYDIPVNDVLYFFSYNTSKNYYFNKSGDSVTFHFGTVTLFYSFQDSKVGNGAVFYIETANEYQNHGLS